MRTPDRAASVPPVTVAELRRVLAGRFRAAGLSGRVDLDAHLLTAAATGIDPAVIPFHGDATVDDGAVARAAAFAERRIAGEPVARILGRKEFWGLDLVLSPATLVPRPDTETVVEAALAYAASRGMGRPRILDLGTGSGAILLALLSELWEATGVGADLSPAAAATARENARRLGLADRASFTVGNWGVAIASAFDLVVANPPYIASDEIAGLDIAVRAHDPALALDGGTDGLDALRAVMGDLGRLLVPGGAAFIEIGAGQGEAVAGIATGLGFTVRFTRDLAGVERVAVLAWPG